MNNPFSTNDGPPERFPPSPMEPVLPNNLTELFTQGDLIAQLSKLESSKKVDTYKVPQRFGMSGILALMTLYSITFGGARFSVEWLRDEVSRGDTVALLIYGYLACLLLITSITQMWLGEVPRMASLGGGAIFTALFFIVVAGYYSGAVGIAVAILSSPINGAFGAFLGYLAGTLTAGCFLVMDKLEQHYLGKRPPGKAVQPAK